MDIICPHCGTEYEAEESEYGRFVKCEICGKGFVAGASIAKRVSVVADGWSKVTNKGGYYRKGHSTDHSRQRNGAVRQIGKLVGLMKTAVSHAPWQIQFVSCYYVVYGVAMSIACGIWGLVDRNFPDMLLSPLPAVFLVLMTTLFLSCRWMYWLIISFGVIAFVICALGGVTMFSIGLVVCAIMLLHQPCRRWNLLREKREKSVSSGTAKKVAIAAVSLAIISAIVSFSAIVGEIQDARSHVKTRNSNKKMAEGDVLEMYGRYYKKLDYYNLEEYLFNDGSECTELVLMDKSSGRTCQIVYDKRGEVFQWSQSIPKGFAEELLLERLRISKCEKR